MKTYLYISLGILLSILGAVAHASALPTGSPLRIYAGAGATTNVPCTSGSCVGIEISPGFVSWSNLTPGTDGGIIAGKNQQPGEITAVLNGGYFVTAPQFNSLCTSDASANRFDDLGGYGSCAGADCVGKTELNTWHMVTSGVCTPLGGGTVTKYSFDSVRGGWRLDYRNVIPDGPYKGLPYYMILSGRTPYISDPIPQAQDVSFSMVQDTTAVWNPVVSILGDLPITCTVATQPAHGVAIVAYDCSQGTYTPDAGYVGPDTFIYAAFGGIGSDTGTVFANVLSSCALQNPIVMLTTEGSGQGAAVNATLATTFIGHITGSTSNSIAICPGTRLEFKAQSITGPAICRVNGIVVGASGFLKSNDRLICSNRPEGEDVDRFNIR